MAGLTTEFRARSRPPSWRSRRGSTSSSSPRTKSGRSRGILEAVRSGRISPARIDRSVRKILTLKEWAGLPEAGPVDLAAASSVVGGESSRRLAKEIARASVTLLRNDGILPLGTGKGRILHVVVNDIEDYRTEINRPDIPWPNERAGDYYSTLIKKPVEPDTDGARRPVDDFRRPRVPRDARAGRRNGRGLRLFEGPVGERFPRTARIAPRRDREDCRLQPEERHRLDREPVRPRRSPGGRGVRRRVLRRRGIGGGDGRVSLRRNPGARTAPRDHSGDVSLRVRDHHEPAHAAA